MPEQETQQNKTGFLPQIQKKKRGRPAKVTVNKPNENRVEPYKPYTKYTKIVLNDVPIETQENCIHNDEINLNEIEEKPKSEKNIEINSRTTVENSVPVEENINECLYSIDIIDSKNRFNLSVVRKNNGRALTMVFKINEMIVKPMSFNTESSFNNFINIFKMVVKK